MYDLRAFIKLGMRLIYLGTKPIPSEVSARLDYYPDYYKEDPFAGFLPLTPTEASPTVRASSPHFSNQRNTCS